MRRRPADPQKAPGMIAEILQHIRLVWRLLWDRRVPYGVKAILPGILVYILSPIDLIPDLFVGLGQIDDLAIILLALKLFIQLSPRSVVDEHLANLNATGRSSSGASSSSRSASHDSASFIDGQYRVVDDQRSGR